MTDMPTPDRNLAMELVRVTEAAALAAARWVGGGDKDGADGAAVDAMRHMLTRVSMNGIVIIGEGEKDEAPMLYNGEVVGDGTGFECDIAVDPIDGTTLTALGRGNAIAVIAVSERGTMFDPGPCVYMDKIAVGPEAARRHRHQRSRSPRTSRPVAEAKGSKVRDLTAVILDRDASRASSSPRSAPPAPASASSPTATSPAPSPPPGPTPAPTSCSASAARPRASSPPPRSSAWAATIQGKLWPRNDDERDAALDAGYDLDQVLTTDILVAGDNCFFAATGITDGELLKGVHYTQRGATTQSLVMRSRSGTVRLIDAQHRPDKFTQPEPTPVRRFGVGTFDHGEEVDVRRTGCQWAAAAAGWRRPPRGASRPA